MSKYVLMNYLASIALLAFNLLHIKEKRMHLGARSRAWIAYFSKNGQQQFWTRLFSKAAFWAVAETVLISLLQYISAPFANEWLGNILGTGTNYFGLFLVSPILMIAGCMFLQIDFRYQIDLITPAFPLALIVSKFGCYFANCCGGREFDFLGGEKFPSQLLEAAIAAIMFFYLLLFRKRAESGTMFPVYMILYSSTRFFSEFFREEENMLGIFKLYHFLCVGGVFLGIVTLNFILEYNAYLESTRKRGKKGPSNNKEDGLN